MHEVLLETLVGKVADYQKQAQEIREMIKGLPDLSPALDQIGERIDRIEGAVKEIPDRIAFPESAMLDLEKELQRHRRKLEEPLKKELWHHHHISKPLLACIVLVAIVLTLMVFLESTWNQARQHRDADVKYRYLKLYGGTVLVKRLDSMDSVCLADPDGMRNEVEQEEDRRREEARKWEQLQEKKAEVKEMEREGRGK
jgi:hypothetical protein